MRAHVAAADSGRFCCIDGWPGVAEGGGVNRTRRSRPPVQAPSAFAGFRFPPDVIMLAVRWYLRYALSHRDLEELLAERGINVDHVTLFRWFGAVALCDHMMRGIVGGAGTLQIASWSSSNAVARRSIGEAPTPSP